ncbi:unnamed protein product [Coregonus sp. 'balchen']|nr:unnamed protein product [Coregonus sp. 'balchen']
MAEKEPEGIIAIDPSDNDDRKCLIIRKLLKFNPKEVFTCSNIPVPGFRLPRGRAHAPELYELHTALPHLHHRSAVQNRPIHYVSVCVCLLGVGAMVGADLLAGRDLGSTSDVLLGDGLVLLSASLYAVSNLYAHSGQEDQCYSSQPLPAHCRPPQPLLWPVSLSIHGPITPSVGWEEGGYDNPDDIINEDVVVAVLEEKEEQEEEEGERPGVSWNQRTQKEEVPAGGWSTKM